MLTQKKNQQAEAALQSAKENMNARFRLGYHIMAPANWINDPNGLIYFNNEYHAFYQHHPYDENWGPMHWGHVKSKDLVHWEHLPIALVPGDECDRDGCFSGSAVDNDGELTLIYTGHHYIDKEKDIFYQNQNIATSGDGITFEKSKQNPVISAPPSDSGHHFRDPKVWKYRDSWYMIIGNASKVEIGRVILYKSSDLYEWEYVGVVAESDGTQGYMWECPDFFELNGKQVLLVSPQGMKAEGNKYRNLFQTGYFIGDYDYEKNIYNHGKFTELDNGHDFYAVQTFLDGQGRRIAIGWMDMWESLMPTKEDGWCGALTMPRVLTLTEDNKIHMNPPDEITLLRESETEAFKDKIIGESHLIDTKEKLIEFQIEFDLKATNAETAGIKIRGEKDEQTVLSFEKSTGVFTLDCSRSGKRDDGIRRTQLHTDEVLSLRVFIDRSSIEIFINEGQATMTSRIYPENEMLGVEVFAENGTAKINDFNFWKLKDIWK